MTKQITRQQLSAALVERHGQERQQHLYTASVGIAGLGGLGSNIAVQLTRLGIGHLTLADCDRVEISNLNRQSYRLCDIGRPKPEALTEQLLQINPYLSSFRFRLLYQRIDIYTCTQIKILINSGT